MSMRKSLTLFTALLLALVATMSAVQAEPRAHASHILVDTEAEADEMHAQLREASNVFATFAVLAKEHSKCPSSKKGGDLGKFGRGQMVPQFDKVVFEEEVGVVHKVQTQFGWHLVLISTRFDSDDEPDQGFEYYLAYYVNKASPFMGPIIIIIIMYFGNRSANKPMGVKARASHILVKTEAEADECLKQITAAKDPKKKLAELAAEKSSCPSGKKGGDLGMFGPGQMVPAFDKVVFSAEVDTFHKVQTQVRVSSCSFVVCVACRLTIDHGFVVWLACARVHGALR